MNNVLLVFIGGGLGSVLRYLIGVMLRQSQLTLPVATFVSNLLACLVFALVVRFAKPVVPAGESLQLLLLTGFCGGLSTFSAFGYETFLLLRQDLTWLALMNVLVSTLMALGMFQVLMK